MTKKEQILQLQEQGLTVGQICETLNIYKSTVYYWTKPEKTVVTQLKKRTLNRERHQNNFRSYCVSRLNKSRNLAKAKGHVACSATPEELMVAYTGLCAICEAKLVRTTNSKVVKRQMTLDHDHTTGKFRGWLCSVCNRGLGLLGDDPQLVAERLISYAQTPPLAGSGDGANSVAATKLFDASIAL